MSGSDEQGRREVTESRRRLYLDVDGVLLGKEDPSAAAVTLARHAREFLEFALSAFDCYWLTTHCRGDAGTVLEYLRPYASPEVLQLLAQVRPTTFRNLKTEALAGDFLWLDDSPLATEIDRLREAGHGGRWIEVDTRRRPDDLLRAMDEMRRHEGSLP